MSKNAFLSARKMPVRRNLRKPEKKDLVCLLTPSIQMLPNGVTFPLSLSETQSLSQSRTTGGREPSNTAVRIY
jgi:hypothetical protein